MLRFSAREFKLMGDVLRKPLRFYSAQGQWGKLEGKVALITGGANGLGKATAREFIKHGAQVIIADIDSQIGSEAANELGHAAHFVHCDVTVETQVAEAVNAAVARHGRLDIMHNNAGIAGPIFPQSITDLDLDVFDQVMQVNVRGIMAGIKHAARVMVSAGSGSILCTSSISGVLGGLGPHSYAISKFTIPGIVKSIASDLSQHGVRINCISPGPIPTPYAVSLIGQLYPGVDRERVLEIIKGLSELKGATCEEIDVAKAALYLASNEAKYVTGHNLVIDGGFTCFKSLGLPSPDQVV